MTNAKLLAEYSVILNRGQSDKKFLEKHKENKELIELCELVKLLKEALKMHS